MTQQLLIKDLKDHPDNPRLFLREDVISGIAAQIKEAGKFDPAHALLVRPINDHYQIIRGHHRKEAATICNLETVPCWVREMTDDEAYLQLALGNVQGELSPLEIGIHALGIDFDKRGMGASGGGLKGYAESIGKNRGDISSYKNGAFVFKSISLNVQTNEILKKAAHLAAIHKTPSEVWPLLVEWMLTPKDPNKPDNTLSVSQVNDLVREVNKYDIPAEWQEVFLSLPSIIGYSLEHSRPTPIDVKSLVNEAYKIKRLIEADTGIDSSQFPYTTERFFDWLKSGIGGYSWVLSDLEKYKQDVVDAIQAAIQPPEPEPGLGEWWQLGRHKIYCGDTSQPEFYRDLPVAVLAFADPPYNAGVAKWDNDFNWHHDWLMDKANAVIVTPGISSIFDFARITSMPYVWSIAGFINNGMTRGAMGFGNWIYAAVFATKSIHKNSQDIVEFSISEGPDGEKRKKPNPFIEWLVEKFTERGDLVIDPFLGTGTTLFVSDNLGRVFIGGEKNPEDCKKIIIKWQNETGQTAERI